MAERLGEALLDLNTDDKGFTKGIQRAKRWAEELGKRLDITAEGAIKMGRNLALASTAAAGAMAVLVKRAIDQADTMSKAAAKAGATTEALSRLAWAGELSDVSLDTLTASMARLANVMAQVATGQGKDVKAIFDGLGISVTDTNGRLRSTDAVMADFADVFASLEDGADKTALAIQVFGKSGAALIPLLNSGKQGLADMGAEADRLGLTISTEMPACLFELSPMRLYDPRKDSTNGGSGAHRWNDQSTWEPSDNNAVLIYNFIRGVYYGTEWIFGGQNLSAFRLPASNWIAAANECDRLVDKADGSQEKQFRCGYEIRGDMEPLSVIDDLRQGCAGRIAEVGGIFKMLVAAPGAAVYSFTDDDILVTEDQSFEPFPALSETHNGIEATYPEPAEKWASKDAPARYSSTLEAADGNRRLATGVEFPAVPFRRQVQTLMKAMIEEERRFRVHMFHMPPDAFPLEPNDVVSWTSTRNGYQNKKFLIVRILGKLTFNQLVVLKEIDPSDYSWSGSDQLPTEVGWLGPIEPPAQPMTGWTVAADTIKDATGGDRRPAILVGCAADLDDVRSVRVQVRVKQTAAVVFDSDATRYEGPYQWLISGAWCLPATTFQARGKLIPNSTRVTDWSAWLDVTTPNVRLGDDDVYLPGVVEDLQKFVGDATDWMRDGLRQTILEQQRIARLTLDNDFTAYTDRQQTRQELTSTGEGAKAYALEQVTVATGPESALAQKITVLQAIVPTLATASALSLLTATVNSQGSTITALSQDVTELEATIPTLATAAALSSLTTTVTSQGNSITALGLRLDNVEATIPNLATASALSSLQAQVTAIDGDVDSQATAITALEASYNSVSAGANFRMSVSAGVDGYASRIGMDARVGGSGTWRSASLFIDIPSISSNPTRVAIMADQFVVTNGPNSENPFIFQNGVATLNVANIGTVNSGRLLALNGKMDINLNNGTIEIYS